MAETWSNSSTLKFLELYEKNECLWNPKLDEYVLQDARKQALVSIIRDIQKPNLTILDIKKKIKAIRSSYKRELLLVLKSSDDKSGKQYEPKLFWFKRADSFLRNVYNKYSNTVSFSLIFS